MCDSLPSDALPATSMPRLRPRILCVDDEPNVLAGLVRMLRREFEVVTAGDGAAGLEVLARQGPFIVVVSDFMMPGMTGVQFLARAKQLAPDTVRILLTGQASLEGAIASVNEGNIFRFLSKPCSREHLVKALEDAIEQARLVTADRELLERKLEDMSADLLRVHRARLLVLDNVSDGLVTVGVDGTMSSECSAALVAWMGAPREGDLFWRFLARHDPDFAASVETVFRMLRAGDVPLEVCLDQLPTRALVGSTPLGFRYRPVSRGGPVSHVLVVVRDLTPEIENERLEADQRELMSGISQLVQDPAEFLGFLKEASALVAQIIPSPSTVGLRRALHTLKANSDVMGLGRFAVLCHELEGRVVAGGVVTAADAAEVHARWATLHDRFLSVLRVDGPDIAITLEEHRALVQMVKSGASRGDLVSRIEQLALTPARPVLERFAARARDLALQLGKANVRVVVQADEAVRHNARLFAPFWAAFVHSIRNVVDHGVDAERDRVAAGKPAIATIQLTARALPDGLTVEVTDDGPGIDWAAVRRRALQVGVPANDRAECRAALFFDGVSARETVSVTSGRGIGMGALKVACEAIGGEVTVLSEAGRGTTLLFVFRSTPLSKDEIAFNPDSVRPYSQRGPAPLMCASPAISEK